MNAKWEYKILKLEATGFLGGKLDSHELDSWMNDLGRKGWELVAAFDTNQSGGQSREVYTIFKRQLS